MLIIQKGILAMLKHPCLVKRINSGSAVTVMRPLQPNIENSIIWRKQDQDTYGSVGSKSFSCYLCNYTVFSKDHLIDHMIVHDNNKYVLDHTKRNICNANATVSRKTDKLWKCSHCNATFTSKVSLNDHKIRTHPDFISSITSKIHECTICTFKTALKSAIDKHLLKHPEVASDFKFITCIHCNATFKEKRYLDSHVFRKHPDFRTSVTRKLHECPKCSFKTVIKTDFNKHWLKHFKVASDFKLYTCIHCNATFKGKLSLDDHVVRKHPDFMSSVTSKLHKCTKCTFKTVKKLLLDNHLFRKHPDIVAPVTCKLYECTKCTFKTTVKGHFDRHLLKHPEIASDFKLSACIHCNATFRQKMYLDDHVVREHPDFATSVTSKVHECTKCTFKTTVKGYFDRHLLKHPETASDFKFSTCIHCNATFKEKRYLDEHVVKEHPDFVISVTRKLFKCTKCAFQTVLKHVFENHLLKHPEVASDFKPTTCIYCNVTLVNKANLDNHVVRKHPEFIATVASKIHECPKCTYKTTLRDALQKHMSAHPENVSSQTSNTCTHCSATFRSKTTLQRHMSDHFKKERKPFRCVHCNATLTRKPMLDEHIIKKHPDFMSSVTSKLHECTKCTFKTVEKRSLNRHLLKHPEVATGCSSKLDGP
ncbi:unnamed protein product [Callosobruchus maculatus]|uniref:C2H2-type domain-containing protein n=1 Tax=Callosobruchus maculatus TaxID=64391 RepID=A0A653C2P5_CALMS|nr:unnamed protein product [Callosobruchus maculatus]